jgi:hypothetical protein
VLRAGTAEIPRKNLIGSSSDCTRLACRGGAAAIAFRRKGDGAPLADWRMPPTEADPVPMVPVSQPQASLACERLGLERARMRPTGTRDPYRSDHTSTVSRAATAEAERRTAKTGKGMSPTVKHEA